MAIPLLLVFFKLASVCTCPSDDLSPALGDPLAWKWAGSSTLTVFVCGSACVSRGTDIKQMITTVFLLYSGVNPLWDSPPLTLIPTFHSMLPKFPGFCLLHLVLRVKERVRG